MKVKILTVLCTLYWENKPKSLNSDTGHVLQMLKQKSLVSYSKIGIKQGLKINCRT